jgi:hypothetical protein
MRLPVELGRDVRMLRGEQQKQIHHSRVSSERCLQAERHSEQIFCITWSLWCVNCSTWPYAASRLYLR